MRIYVTDFAGNAHFKGGGGTQIDTSKEEFATQVNSLLDSGKATVKPSLYPFCKYIIVPNFTTAKPGTVEITQDNQKYLRCAWKARREGELPFLSKNLLLPHNYKLPTATHLVVIVYSREQLEKEESDFETGETVASDFGVVAIQANMYPDVELMTPATMIRNAMGKELGGNGEDIVQEYILESEKFWATHASAMLQKQHPEYIDRFQGSAEQLAEDIGNLRYDALSEFLGKLSTKLKTDAKADAKAGKKLLSEFLSRMGDDINNAKFQSDSAWLISEPHMNQK